MHGLRRSIGLAAVAAVGLTPGTAGAAGAEFITGVPCALTGIAPAGGESYTAALTCFAWIDGQAALEGITTRADTWCGTVQVGTAEPLGPWGGAATTCGSDNGDPVRSSVVTYAAGPADRVYVCTYISHGNDLVYDADNDDRNGTQCAEVHTQDDTGVSGCPTGMCLKVVPNVREVIDTPPFPGFPPGDPTCAGCLSGIGPVVNELYDAVLAVDLVPA